AEPRRVAGIASDRKLFAGGGRMSRQWRAIGSLLAAAMACGEGDPRSQAVAPPAAAPSCAGDPAATHQVVKDCGEITSSGCFTLEADLGSGRGAPACLVLHDASNVELDCAGHSISPSPAIAVRKVSGFRIHGCTIE